MDEAQLALRGVLADIERGVWQPPAPPPPEPEGMPTFHEFAEQWWLLNEQQLAPKTKEAYRWRLERPEPHRRAYGRAGIGRADRAPAWHRCPMA